jgi:hypothetical protein
VGIGYRVPAGQARKKRPGGLFFRISYLVSRISIGALSLCVPASLRESVLRGLRVLRGFQQSFAWFAWFAVEKP